MVDAHRRCDPLRIAHAAAYRLRARILTGGIIQLWPVAAIRLSRSSCNELDAAIRCVPTSISWDGDVDVGTYHRDVCSVGAFSPDGALARLANTLDARSLRQLGDAE